MNVADLLYRGAQLLLRLHQVHFYTLDKQSYLTDEIQTLDSHSAPQLRLKLNF